MYKTAGKSDSVPCTLRAASLENIPEISLTLITHWNVATYVSASGFKEILRILHTCRTTVACN